MGNKSDIMQQYDQKQRLYKNFASETAHQLQRILSEEGISYNAITYRVKDRESLGGKLDRKGDKYTCLEDLTDIAGVRVITYYSGDVDRVADIVEHEFSVDRENSIDKREALEPDRFGYCSVHYVVEMSEERLRLREYQSFKGLKCEIQIRSVLQHAWAEIEHDLGYKNPITLPKEIRRNFSRLAGLLEIADKEFQDIRQFLSSYEENVAEKMENNELENEDIEINAILLNKLVETNQEIISINSEIQAISGLPFMEEKASSYEESIENLHWLGIHTLNQLYDLIHQNSKYAIEIAREFFAEEEEVGVFIHRSIVFFYLCYAELVVNVKRYDLEDFVEYFQLNHLRNVNETEEEAAWRLFRLREKFHISE